jgi:hypothetical protein
MESPKNVAEPLEQFGMFNVDVMEEFRREQILRLHGQGYKLPGDEDKLSIFEKELTDDVLAAELAEVHTQVDTFFNRNDDPELFNNAVSKIYEYSALHISEDDWYSSNPNDPESSPARDDFQADAIESMSYYGQNFAVDPPAKPRGPKPTWEPVIVSGEIVPLATETAQNLRESRERYAELSVKFGRKIVRKAENNPDYREAVTAYQIAYAEALPSIVAAKNIDVVNGNVRADLAELNTEELRELHQAEAKILAEDTSLRGKFSRFIHKTKKRFVAASVVAGAAGGLLAKTTASKAFGATGKIAAGVAGATGGLLVAVGVAAGTTRGIIKSLIGNRGEQLTQHDANHADDARNIAIKINEYVIQDSVAANLDFAANSLHSVLRERVEANRKANARRIGKAAIIGAVSGATTGILGDEIIEYGGKAVSFAGDFIEKHHGFGLFGLAGHLKELWPFGAPGAPTVDVQNIHDSGSPLERITPDTGDATQHGPGYKHTEGFDRRMSVRPDDGPSQVLQVLAEQKDIDLSGKQALAAVDYIQDQTGKTYFSDVREYPLGNGYDGFANSDKHAHLRPVIARNFQAWLEQRNLAKAA